MEDKTLDSLKRHARGMGWRTGQLPHGPGVAWWFGGKRGVETQICVMRYRDGRFGSSHQLPGARGYTNPHETGGQGGVADPVEAAKREIERVRALSGHVEGDGWPAKPEPGLFD